MSRASSALRSFFLYVVLAFPGAIVACDGCKRPTPAQPDVAAPPEPDSGTLAIAELDADTGDAADAAEAAPKHGGTQPVNPNEVKARQCCAQLQARANALPNPASPEMVSLKAALAKCNEIVAVVHNNPNAPELNALRALPGCQ